MIMKYKVTTDGKKLRVRDNPSTASKELRLLTDGSTVLVRNQFQNEGEQWGQLHNSRKNAPKEYVMMKYLEECPSEGRCE